MTALTLADFLLARIAEDEGDARAAAAPEGERWHCHYAPYEGTWIVGGSRDGCEQGVDHEYDRDEPWHPHVNRHDSARVLAECGAKRAIVGHLLDAERDVRHASPEDIDGAEITYDRVRCIAADVAKVYAAHPDHGEEW